jgi:hypothetical protein
VRERAEGHNASTKCALKKSLYCIVDILKKKVREGAEGHNA